jgi:hypothetical protein
MVYQMNERDIVSFSASNEAIDLPISKHAFQLRWSLALVISVLSALFILIIVPFHTHSSTTLSAKVEIFSNISSGTLIINGQHTSVIHTTIVPQEGINEIDATISPFLKHSCRFHMPGFTILTPEECALWGEEIYAPGKGTDVYLLGLTFTLGDLPPHLRNDVTNLISSIPVVGDHPIDTMIPPHNHFSIESAKTTGINQSVHAVLTHVINLTPINAAITLSDDDQNTAFPLWFLQTHIADKWIYTDSQGDMLGESIIENTLSISITLRPVNGSFQYHSSRIETAQLIDFSHADICTERPMELSQFLAKQQNPINVAILFDKGINGCELEISTQPQGGQQPRFLIRYGALLAVNQLAHNLINSVPFASQDEIDVVEH